MLFCTWQVTEAKSNEEIQQLIHIHEMTDCLLRAGFLKQLTLENRDMALQNLIVYEVLVKRKEACDQFCRGLQSLGVHSAVQSCSEAMSIYFVAQPSHLSAANILELFSNIEVTHECDRCERARNFLVTCINCLGQGIKDYFSISCLAAQNVIFFPLQHFKSLEKMPMFYSFEIPTSI